MNIKQYKVTSLINLLIFDTQKEGASTFLRFQEFYESPKFMGKIFSLNKFKKWYIKNSPNGQKTGEFTYYSDWNGFNIPSYVLQPFYEGKFDPISKQERELLEIFKDESKPFYIIGTHNKTKNLDTYLRHEVAHGMFFTNKGYRGEVLEILSKFNIEPIIEELKLKAGYHSKVLDDEIHAYAIDTGKKLKTQIPKKLVTKLRRLYNKYLKINNVCLQNISNNCKLYNSISKI